MNMQNLMAQAQKMQKDLQKKKDEINSQIFTGKSDWVEVSFNGKKELVSIKILYNEPILEEDHEMLEDMIHIAMKEAISKIDSAFQEKMGSYAGMLDGLM